VSGVGKSVARLVRQLAQSPETLKGSKRPLSAVDVIFAFRHCAYAGLAELATCVVVMSGSNTV